MNLIQMFSFVNNENDQKGFNEEIRKINLEHGEFIVVSRKPRNQENQNNNNNNNNNNDSNNNESEILIDFSEDEDKKENKKEKDHSILWEELDSQVTNCEEMSSSSNSDEKFIPFNPKDNQRQTNMSARIKDIYWKNKEDASKLKQSSVLCMYQNKYYFQLRFYARNVKMSFIRHSERRMTDEMCEKFVQPRSFYHYSTYTDRKSNKQVLMKMNHVLLAKASVDLRSKSEETKEIYDEPKPKLKLHRISSVKRAKFNSYIYITYKNVSFVCHPPKMTIESMKPIVDDENRFVNDASDMYRSRGSILIKYKNDLLLFKFEMSTVTFDQIWLKTSRATQSVDRNSYIRYFSMPCNKVLHCAVPISTYKYKDPLVKIKYANRKQLIYGLNPSWMKEERRNRLKRFCQLKEMSASRKFELSFRTTFLFECQFGMMCKIRFHLQKGILLDGDYQYERMAMTYQRQQTASKKKEKEQLFMTEINQGAADVVDNNLSLFDL